MKDEQKLWEGTMSEIFFSFGKNFVNAWGMLEKNLRKLCKKLIEICGKFNWKFGRSLREMEEESDENEEKLKKIIKNKHKQYLKETLLIENLKKVFF